MQRQTCLSSLKENIEERIETFVDVFGVGVPTTCGYKMIADDEHEDCIPFILAYFIMGGFGCCVRIRSDLYHYFYAYTFSHSTAIPVVVVDDEVLYCDAGVNVFAWGAGGD